MRVTVLSIMLANAIFVTSVYGIDAEEQTIKVVEKAKNSVVSIEVKKKSQKNTEEWWEFPEELKKWIPEIKPRIRGKKFKFEIKPMIPEKVQGSGFVFEKADDGYYLITSAHVVKDAKSITVVLPDGSKVTEEDIDVVGIDTPTDLAILKIKTREKLNILPFGDSDRLRVGQWVIAVGNPFGLRESFSLGIISALGRSNLPIPGGPEYQEFIQTDAAINPGNSGGPLIDMKGKVIGVVTAIDSRDGVNSGVGFAIPINTAKWVAKSLIEEGKVSRGYLGVYIQDLTPDLAEGMGIGEKEGVLVTDVIAGTPADEAGFEEGDVIVKVNGKKVTSTGELRARIAQLKPGSRAKITIIRDGKYKDLSVKIGERPEETAELATPGQYWGMDLEEEDGKVRVDWVKPNSPADDAGIMENDYILKIGKVEISSLKDVRKAVKKYSNSERPILLIVERNKHKRFLTLRP